MALRVDWRLSRCWERQTESTRNLTTRIAVLPGGWLGSGASSVSWPSWEPFRAVLVRASCSIRQSCCMPKQNSKATGPPLSQHIRPCPARTDRRFRRAFFLPFLSVGRSRAREPRRWTADSRPTRDVTSRSLTPATSTAYGPKSSVRQM